MMTAVSVLFASVACTTSTTGQTTSSSADQTSVSTATTASASSGAHAAPNKYNDGTTFDPCTAYTADEIRSLGLDPTTIADVDDPQLRGCRWMDGPQKAWAFTNDVLNTTVQKYLEPDSTKYVQRSVTIAGLEAAVYSVDRDGQGCDVVLPSQQAVVFITISLHDPQRGRELVPDTCAKAVDVATFVAGKLPK